MIQPNLVPQSPEDLFRTARLSLSLRVPFMGTAMKLQPVPNNNIATIRTDGETIEFNTDWFAGLPVERQRGAIAEVTLQNLLGHPWRIGRRNLNTWRQASALQCHNIMSNWARYGVSGAFLNDMDPESLRRIRGESTDAIYRLIDNEEVVAPEGMNDSFAFGDPDTGEETFREWQRMFWSEMNRSKTEFKAGGGSMPGSLLVELQELARAAVDWVQVLRNFFNQKTPAGSSWAKPNQLLRHITPFLMPSKHHQRKLGEVVIAVDTSGSTNRFMDYFLGEVEALFRQAKPTLIHYLHCDTEVRKHWQLRPGDRMVREAYGGGGTRFGPVFQWVRENLTTTPDALVYLTDLECNSVVQDPKFPVFWATPTGVDLRYHNQRTFGTILELPRDYYGA